MIGCFRVNRTIVGAGEPNELDKADRLAEKQLDSTEANQDAEYKISHSVTRARSF